MISDFIKGKKQFDYPAAVQKGIRLHRAIDQFTDDHPATKALKSFFRPDYRLYSGAFADITYDYFLANDRNEFADEEVLKKFAASTYQLLQPYQSIFPERFAKMFPYMQQQDWLSNYRFPYGIEKSFGGLVNRAAYLKESAVAFQIFSANLPGMKNCYDAFFPELKVFAADTMQLLLKQ